MIAFRLKNLTFLVSNRYSKNVDSCISPVSFSFSLHFFSTSTETQLGIISPTTILDTLLRKYDFPPQLASRVASELTRLKTLEKAMSVLSFFEATGFSNAQLQKILKHKPRFLTANVEDSFKPKIKIFQEKGFSTDDICQVISANPKILHLSLNNNIIPSLRMLKELLGSNDEVVMVIRRASWFLTSNLEKTVLPNVEFLKTCGVPMDRIHIILRVHPNSLSVNPEILRKSAEKVEEMGLNVTSKNFIYAIITFVSMSNETWEIKLQAFRNLGFSDSDVLGMFRRAPLALSTSTEKIKNVTELLLATGKFNISSIVNSPMSLASSIETRYKPRLKILGALESKNLIKKWPSLTAIHHLSDDEFRKRFISPYLNELGDVYITRSSGWGKKGMKPKA